jgi:hypothetical protein
MGLELWYVEFISSAVTMLMNSVVGSGNHRQFVMFITTLVFGILLFDYLSFNCMSHSTYLASQHSYSSSLLIIAGVGPKPTFTLVHIPSGTLRCYGSRHLPLRRHRLGHTTIELDATPRGCPTLADRAPDDHARSLESRTVRLHGWAWSIHVRPDGTSSYYARAGAGTRTWS